MGIKYCHFIIEEQRGTIVAFSKADAVKEIQGLTTQMANDQTKTISVGIKKISTVGGNISPDEYADLDYATVMSKLGTDKCARSKKPALSVRGETTLKQTIPIKDGIK